MQLITIPQIIVIVRHKYNATLPSAWGSGMGSNSKTSVVLTRHKSVLKYRSDP